MNKRIQPPVVYALCGVHNNISHTRKLLKCLENQDFPNIKIVIVDDGSTDGTQEDINKRHPGVTVIRGDGTLWWTGAIALGLEKIQTTAKKNDYVFIINNDCIFGSTLISTLVKESKLFRGAITGSLALDIKKKNVVWDGGVKINWRKGIIYGKPLKLINEIPAKMTSDTDIDTLTTKGTLYPFKVFNKIGNFDKICLPHYLSDYEFACRAKRADFALVLSYRARVYNDTSRTGLGDKIPKRLNYKQLGQLLFDRRSRLNVVDQYNFIKLSCPRKYLARNYTVLVMKFIYLLSFTFPFIIFRPLMVLIGNLILGRKVGYTRN